MSATSGTCGTRRRISLSATAASLSGTARRTTSQPARTISSICLTVPSTSDVSVFVMDCTTTGAPPPICTSLTFTALVCLMPTLTKVRSPKFEKSREPSTVTGDRIKPVLNLSPVAGHGSRLFSFLLCRRGRVVRARDARGELGHVVDDDEAHQEQEEDEADLLDALAHGHR